MINTLHDITQESRSGMDKPAERLTRNVNVTSPARRNVYYYKYDGTVKLYFIIVSTVHS